MSDTNTWPELAIGLYDKLTGRGAEITYNFDNLEVWVPASTQAEAAQAKWKLNGTIVVSTRDKK
jgi:hypothetical protein